MTDGLLSLSWNNHKTTFCHILSTLREKERYSDVTLACEGKFYPTHKLVLSTCSEYFEKMFENTPCKHPVILLGKDVKCDELEALLSYMYDGVVSVAQNDLARLIKVAELLQIKGLAVPDEPPQTKRNYSWNSRDDRTSPHPKRRRREENLSSFQAGEKVTSPPVSPLRLEPEQTWEHSNTSEGAPGEDVSQRLDFPVKHEVANTVQSQETTEETLVKEEIVETVDETPNEDPGADYSSQTGGGDTGTGGEEHSSKFIQHLDPIKAQPLHEAVVEALAGPSGMQGWLGTGDMGTGFPILESFSEEGNQDPQPVPVSGTQQPHQMVGLNSDGTRNNWRGTVGKLHQCPYCKYSTFRKDHITKHIRTHTGEKPFTCSFCDYCAASKDNLKLHVRTHTGEKPFSCPYCPFRAARKDSLQVHIRIHTGEKPYACSKCSYRSSQRNALVSHMLKHQSPEQSTS
ncbi:zinc finger and BTB domain-containing protein 7B-like isoform X6 [Macrobrachium nipponense]|uniref:zinc finger and BTB domain-containing protein 7B-like isoform X6 n=1 Tax=Macrobrachium nipponense TaxID=159736 RepID=UPI0030C8529E